MLHRILILLLALLYFAPPGLASPRQNKVTTLEQALTLVRKQNPLIKTYSHRIQAANASVSQAEQIPNPGLEVGIEEFGGDFSGFSESESSIAIIQAIELGGKRKARTLLSKAEANKVELEARIHYLETISKTEIAFARVLAAQSLIEILRQQRNVSQKVVKNAKKRLSAGALLQVEETKALISFNNDTLELNTAESKLFIVKQTLSTFWNGGFEDIGELKEKIALQDADKYLQKYDLTNSPYNKLNASLHSISVEKTNLEKSLAVPDLNIGVGYKRLESSNENTFLGSISIDIPVFSRNQGSIASANSQEQVERLVNENKSVLLANKFSVYQIKLKRLLDSYKFLNSSIIPSARIAFKQVNNSYNSGRTSHLELLDAQRTLTDSRIRKSELLFEITKTISLINKYLGTSSPKKDEENFHEKN